MNRNVIFKYLDSVWHDWKTSRAKEILNKDLRTQTMMICGTEYLGINEC